MLVPWLFAPGWTLKLYVVTLVVASAVAVAFYVSDARRKRRQVPLIAPWKHHLVAFVGGWPGAWFGSRMWPTQRPITFRVVFWLIIIAHLGFLALMLLSLILP